MYPGFIKQARAERNTDALRVFNFAKSAETEHAKFYQAALNGMDSWKAAKKDFYVCNHCGFTVEKITFDKCPVCFEPKIRVREDELGAAFPAGTMRGGAP